MLRNKAIATVLTAFTSMVLFSSCSKEFLDIFWPVESIVEDVSLNYSDIELAVGSSITLRATLNPVEATDKVNWSSSDKSIATVNNDGEVVGVAVGNVTITAKAGGKSATCNVSVIIPVSKVTLNKSTLTMKVGESETLVATITPSDATYDGIEWSSSNTSIATVGNDGKVNAIKAGTATITAKVGSKTASCSVTVKSPVVEVTSVTISRTSLNLKVGEQAQISATVYPSNATDGTKYWSTSDKSVAYISISNNIVSIVAAGTGTAIITVQAGNCYAYCTVTVTNSSSGSISVKYYSCTLYSDHTDISIFADSRISSSEGWGTTTLKKNWKSAVAIIGNTRYTLDASDGASFTSSNTSWGKYYWIWAFKNSTVQTYLRNASSQNPVTIVMTDVNGYNYSFVFKENQSSSATKYRY